MVLYRTRLINSEFDVTDDGSFHDSLEDASKSAILAAIDIAKGLYANGEKQPHIDVVISEDDRVVARHALTVTVELGID